MPEASWYLQHPFKTLRIIVFEGIENPMLVFPFVLLALYSIIIGSVTDFVLTYLIKRFRHRKNRAE
jgi:hypothetical protein